jgi:hypothetical protein
MSSSLIPEKPLTISPSLAATIGLEEAVMLQGLHERMRFSKPTVADGYKWFTFDQSQIEESFPFWQAGDIQRVANSLRDKGVLLLGAENYLLGKALLVALNEKVAASVEHRKAAKAEKKPPAPAASAAMGGKPPAIVPTQGHSTLGAQKLSRDWQPSAEMVKQIKQLGIPLNFINERVPEFIAYWMERNEAHHGWNAKFRSRVIEHWRKEETLFANQQNTAPLSGVWQPSEDAYEVLDRAGVERNFIDEAIPEFILYWREKGESSTTWNTRFVQHVRRQWARYTHALQHDSEPRLLSADWQPSPDVYEICQMANIDIGFAQKQVPEFVLFWRDSKQLHTSWNSKFLQHVKYHWAKRHQLEARNKNNMGFIERHTNKGWREGL